VQTTTKTNRTLYLKILIVPFIFLTTMIYGQAKTTVENNQLWLGYITSTKVSDHYSIWNDFHYVPEGFGIVRTGLTRHFSNHSITGGYAFAWLTPGGDNKTLSRHEHRPWAQLQFNLPVNTKTSFIQRVRYEARFRENIANGEVTDGYVFTNRARFLVSLKRTIGNESKSTIPYVAVSDEVLLNFGDNARDTFDQNRISLSIGIQQKNTQYQLGMMNRYVQAGDGKYVLNHTLTLWVTQKFDLRKMIGKVDHHETVSE
jgi:hypothetical protein